MRDAEALTFSTSNIRALTSRTLEQPVSQGLRKADHEQGPLVVDKCTDGLKVFYAPKEIRGLNSYGSKIVNSFQS